MSSTTGSSFDENNFQKNSLYTTLQTCTEGGKKRNREKKKNSKNSPPPTPGQRIVETFTAAKGVKAGYHGRRAISLSRARSTADNGPARR